MANNQKNQNLIKYIAAIFLVTFIILIILGFAMMCGADSDFNVMAVGAGFLLAGSLGLPIEFLIWKSYLQYKISKEAEAERVQAKQQVRNLEKFHQQIIELSNLYYPQIKKHILSLSESSFYLDSLYTKNYGAFYVFNESLTAKTCINEDGFDFNSYEYSIYNTPGSEAEEKTKILVNRLLQQVSPEIQWIDEPNRNDILLCIVYIIIRNGIITYFSEKWISNYNWDTTNDIANNIQQEEFYSDKKRQIQIVSYYTFYRYRLIQTQNNNPINLYENYPFLSLFNLYQDIVSEIETNYSNQKKQDYETYLFSNSHAGDNIIQNRLIPSSLSKSLTNSIEAIDTMTGKEFEEFLAEFFEKRGYKTTLTPLSGDYGVDVIIENDFVKIGIQAKRYSDKVPNAAVQEAIASLKHYGLDKAMVITNNYFQPSAIQLAKDNGVILWNRDKLIEELSKSDQ